MRKRRDIIFAMELFDEISVVVRAGTSTEEILSLIEKERAFSREESEKWIKQIETSPDYVPSDEEFILGYRKAEDDKEEKINVVFDASSGISKEQSDYIIKALQDLKKLGMSVRPSVMLLSEEKIIKRIPGLLSKEEFETLEKLASEIKNNDLSTSGELGIRELASDFDATLEDMLKANALVKKMAKKIKDAHLSPFEAVLFAHDFCSSFFYNNSNYYVSAREIEGVVKSGNIICVGYASLFKAILDEANLDGLEVGITALEDKKVTSKNGHSNNIVKIRDPKYGIDGTYIDDSCYDSATYYSPKTMCCCLYPASDIDKTTRIPVYYSSRAKGDLYSAGKVDNSVKRVKALRDEHNAFIKANQSEPIGINAYFEGLFNMAIKTGKSPAEASEYAKTLVDDSIVQARTFFSPTAENCFSKMNRGLGIKPSAASLDPVETARTKFARYNRAHKSQQKMDLAEELKHMATYSTLAQKLSDELQRASKETAKYPRKNLELIDSIIDEKEE